MRILVEHLRADIPCGLDLLTAWWLVPKVSIPKETIRSHGTISKPSLKVTQHHHFFFFTEVCSGFAVLCQSLLYINMTQLHTCMYSLFIFFPITVYHRILTVFLYTLWPCLSILNGMVCIYQLQTPDPSLPNPPALVLVQLLSCVRLFATPWTRAHRASLSFTISWSWLKFMLESVMPSNHLILCHPLLFLSSIFPSIRVFSNESALCIKGQNIGSSALGSVPPMNIQDWFTLGWTSLIFLKSKGLARVFSNTTVQKHQFFSAQPFYGPTLTSIDDYWKNHSFD